MATGDKLDCNKTLTIAEDNYFARRDRQCASLHVHQEPPTFVDFNGIDVEKDTQIMAIEVKCVWSSVTPDQDRSEGISIGCLIMRVPLVIRSVPQIH